MNTWGYFAVCMMVLSVTSLVAMEDRRRPLLPVAADHEALLTTALDRLNKEFNNADISIRSAAQLKETQDDALLFVRGVLQQVIMALEADISSVNIAASERLIMCLKNIIGPGPIAEHSPFFFITQTINTYRDHCSSAEDSIVIEYYCVDAEFTDSESNGSDGLGEEQKHSTRIPAVTEPVTATSLGKDPITAGSTGAQKPCSTAARRYCCIQ